MGVFVDTRSGFVAKIEPMALCSMSSSESEESDDSEESEEESAAFVVPMSAEDTRSDLVVLKRAAIFATEASRKKPGKRS